MILKNLIKKLTSLKTLIVLLVLFIISFYIIMGDYIGSAKLMEITGSVGVIDLEFAYTQEFVYSTLEAQGELGRTFYKDLLIHLDFIFPLVYSLLFTSAIVFVYNKITDKKTLLTKLIMFPLSIIIFEYIENICEIIMITNYPDQLATIVVIGSIATICKIIMITVSFIIIIVGIILIIINKLKTNNRGEL